MEEKKRKSQLSGQVGLRRSRKWADPGGEERGAAVRFRRRDAESFARRLAPFLVGVLRRNFRAGSRSALAKGRPPFPEGIHVAAAAAASSPPPGGGINPEG
ncbi:Hypothetical predicted protein [Podarcis lilfordi]|uniref:Uncharacterized protein n=1 Tax=Podarcis lilfordi TaxID=74358 RepID=A0AA35L9W2_9SAUR|nr:Hypothetical predicted protein [Podarcis lilfordi]